MDEIKKVFQIMVKEFLVVFSKEKMYIGGLYFRGPCFEEIVKYVYWEYAPDDIFNVVSIVKKAMRKSMAETRIKGKKTISSGEPTVMEKEFLQKGLLECSWMK